MRATSAYIAGFGTAGSLLAGAAALFVLASAIVAFTGWPQVSMGAPPAYVIAGQPRSAAPPAPGDRLLAAVAAQATVAPRGSATGAAAGSRSPGSARSTVSVQGSQLGGNPRAPIKIPSTSPGPTTSGGDGTAGAGGSGTAGGGTAGGGTAGGGTAGGGVGAPTGGLGGVVARTTNALGSIVTSTGSSLGSTVSGLSGSVAGRLTGLSSSVAGTVGSTGQALGSTVSGTAGAVGSTLSGTGHVVGGLLGGPKH